MIQINRGFAQTGLEPRSFRSPLAIHAGSWVPVCQPSQVAWQRDLSRTPCSLACNMEGGKGNDSNASSTFCRCQAQGPRHGWIQCCGQKKDWHSDMLWPSLPCSDIVSVNKKQSQLRHTGQAHVHQCMLHLVWLVFLTLPLRRVHKLNQSYQANWSEPGPEEQLAFERAARGLVERKVPPPSRNMQHHIAFTCCITLH